jgi:hypothetical protein
MVLVQQGNRPAGGFFSLQQKSLPLPSFHNGLNAIWEVQMDESEWRLFWNALWTSDLTTKAKVFIWRVIAQGLFTGSWALKIPIGDGNCAACLGIVETIPHLFNN